ncbi:hypothetical protein [Modestobacter sp. DSM 44400]|uniref:hypothetical protein n=1 Tax=Modestobacter sp. DSM 44400 TaxID=1550230 RepID=UPI000B877A52|nr:hypothetical protein [Modestobacter sp. DSM 44400]
MSWADAPATRSARGALEPHAADEGRGDTGQREEGRQRRRGQPGARTRAGGIGGDLAAEAPSWSPSTPPLPEELRPGPWPGTTESPGADTEDEVGAARPPGRGRRAAGAPPPGLARRAGTVIGGGDGRFTDGQRLVGTDGSYR